MGFFHIGITCLWPTLAEGEESNYNEISELFDFHTLQFGNSAKAMKFGRVWYYLADLPICVSIFFAAIDLILDTVKYNMFWNSYAAQVWLNDSQIIDALL